VARVTVKETGDKQGLNTEGGEELLKQVGGGSESIPFFAFLDGDGRMIVNSVRPKDPDGKHGGNIGHPVQPYEIDYFMTMLAKAVPGMTEEERSTIEKKLRAQKGAVSAELREQVQRAETAFAKSIADRDAPAFASFVADEAVFNWSHGVSARGSKMVTQLWAPYFKGTQEQLSLEPQRAEVLESGTLAMTSGLVDDAAGKRTGTFTSVWRREANGQWKIVLDNREFDR
jgi:ketosteroid isomerase-like protein